MKTQILDAIAAHNVSKYRSAKANLDNYLTTPAGIGEHPDIVAEAIKLTTEMESAESNLETLNNAYSTDYKT